MSTVDRHAKSDFAPTIRPYELNSFGQRWFKDSGMPNVSIPVPGYPLHHAAIWVGNISLRGEAPVLAVVTAPKQPVEPHQRIWYIGAIAAAEADAPSACFEAAEHGSQALPQAINLLMNFIPIDHYPR